MQTSIMVAALHSTVALEAVDMGGKRWIFGMPRGENICECHQDTRMFQTRDYTPANSLEVVTVWPDSLINAQEVV
jgi:hypothetical protein